MNSNDLQAGRGTPSFPGFQTLIWRATLSLVATLWAIPGCGPGSSGNYYGYDVSFVDSGFGENDLASADGGAVPADAPDFGYEDSGSADPDTEDAQESTNGSGDAAEVQPCGGATCDDGNKCTVDYCDDAIGQCNHTWTQGCVGPAPPCNSNTDCGGGRCDVERHTCVDCLGPGDCGSGKLCQKYSCVAAPPCKSSTDCKPFGKVCDQATGACADCLGNADCSGGAACIEKSCTPQTKCVSDKECAAVCDKQSGVCVACTSGVDCPQGSYCTKWHECKPAICVGPSCGGLIAFKCQDDGGGHVPVKSCDDLDPCTAGDTCASGACVAGAQIVCDDGNPCTVSDTCVLGACVSGKPLLWEVQSKSGTQDGASKVVASVDGGLIVAGQSVMAGKQTTNVWLAKYDSGGKLVWEVNPSPSKPDAPTTLSDLTVLGDGTMVALGQISGPGDAVSAWLFGLTKSGSVQWQQSWTSGDYTFATRVLARDYGYAVCGAAFSSDGSAASTWLTGRGKKGELLWQANYPAATIGNWHGLVALPNGDFMMAGTLGEKARIARVDSLGKVIWVKTYGNLESYASALIEAASGELIVAGAKKIGSSSEYRGWVAAIQPNGAIAWERTIGGEPGSTFNAIVAVQGTGYVLAGSVGTGVGLPSNGWLLGLDTFGNTQWSKPVGGPGDDVLKSLILLQNHAVAAAGWAYEAPGKGPTRWLLKADLFGNTTCDDSGLCSSLTTSCDDGNPCTADGCGGTVAGCTHVALPTGAVCGPGKSCQGGVCK